MSKNKYNPFNELLKEFVQPSSLIQFLLAKGIDDDEELEVLVHNLIRMGRLVEGTLHFIKEGIELAKEHGENVSS